VDTTIKLDYPQDLLNNVSAEDLSAQYVYVLDKTNGEVLFDKNSTMQCYPASTTKILTSIVALEYIDSKTIFQVGSEINLAEEGSSLAYLVKGDELRLKDLIYALMLPSGNDCAYTIAVNVARRVSGNMLLSDSDAVAYFVDLMNKKAQEIGMYDSCFLVPDGYHKKGHYVTAQDMMKLLVYAKDNELLSEVASTQTYSATGINGDEYTWVNTNKLLDEESIYYDDSVDGFKTGFHDDAGNCLIVTANWNGREVYMVIMKSETDTSRYDDATLLLDAIYNRSDEEVTTSDSEA
jgi:D-alanyl-D-alanine carboxypeptidase (penicillin-binding protein 5/6)